MATGVIIAIVATLVILLALAISTELTIFWVVLAFIGGIVAGTYLSRFTLKKHFEENPPISEEMIANMLKSMGQPASQKRVNSIMKNMKASNAKPAKSEKKAKKQN